MVQRSGMRVYQKFLLLALVILAVIVAGSLYYAHLEHIGLGDAVYMVIMIMTGIGSSRDPVTPGGHIFLEILALVSVGLLVGVLTQIFKYISVKGFMAALHDRRIKAMKGHVIVCGTSYTLHELLNRIPKDSLWVIARTGEEAQRLERAGVQVHVDDYTSEQAFKHAGIDTASMVITCSENDADNAFACLSAKALRKDIPVIARINRTENRDKLRTAGADVVIVPAELAAMAIVEAMGRKGMTNDK
jgi:voltage-gated potassium channel